MTLSRFRHGGYVFIGVSKFVVCAKTTQPIFIKFSGKMAHELRKKPLDFDGKPDHSTLGLGRTAMISVAGRCMGSRQTPQHWYILPSDCFITIFRVSGLGGGMPCSLLIVIQALFFVDRIKQMWSAELSDSEIFQLFRLWPAASRGNRSTSAAASSKSASLASCNSFDLFKPRL